MQIKRYDVYILQNQISESFQFGSLVPIGQISYFYWSFSQQQSYTLQKKVHFSFLLPTYFHLEVVKGVFIDVFHLVHQPHGVVSESTDV